MLCFSVENRDSLQNIQDKWIEEIQEHSPYAKLVLVALKCDLRQEKRNTILYEEVCHIACWFLLTKRQKKILTGSFFFN
jgi:Rho family protein